MCGIFAYTGKNDCRINLVEGLQMLEYRGYDSAGIACSTNNGEVFLEKAVGKVNQLARKVNKKLTENKNVYMSGIAHTRWATHGAVTEANTHPHLSSDKRFYIVHNGIIENYRELKKDLEQTYNFYSDTDTEVIVKLLEEIFDGDMVSSMQKLQKKLRGAYSLAVLDRDTPDSIVAMKLGSPLIVGKCDDGVYLSSDVHTLSKFTQSYTILEDYEMLVIKNQNYDILLSGEVITREEEKIDKNITKNELGNFTSFTKKEIYEIPEVLSRTFLGRIDFYKKQIIDDSLIELSGQNIEKICIIASGSSLYAGWVWGYFFRKYAKIHCETIISSEFLSDVFLPDAKTLYVFLSQSGETADVRESLKIVKEKGGKTCGIVNVEHSTIARLCDRVFYSNAGHEVWVASTKNVIAQVWVLLCMALAFGMKHVLSKEELSECIHELSRLPDYIQEVYTQAQHIEDLAQKYSQYAHFFVLGRNIMFPVASEASLKIKELSYIHSEAYSAWELKHGPLALVGPEFPSIVFNPQGKHFYKTISNIEEIRARKGEVLGFIMKNDTHTELYTDYIELPETSDIVFIFTSLCASYIFALALAESLWRDVDKPRNLAKSVTVE